MSYGIRQIGATACVSSTHAAEKTQRDRTVLSKVGAVYDRLRRRRQKDGDLPPPPLSRRIATRNRGLFEHGFRCLTRCTSHETEPRAPPVNRTGDPMMRTRNGTPSFATLQRPHAVSDADARSRSSRAACARLGPCPLPYLACCRVCKPRLRRQQRPTSKLSPTRRRMVAWFNETTNRNRQLAAVVSSRLNLSLSLSLPPPRASGTVAGCGVQLPKHEIPFDAVHTSVECRPVSLSPGNTFYARSGLSRSSSSFSQLRVFDEHRRRSQLSAFR